MKFAGSGVDGELQAHGKLQAGVPIKVSMGGDRKSSFDEEIEIEIMQVAFSSTQTNWSAFRTSPSATTGCDHFLSTISCYLRNYPLQMPPNVFRTPRSNVSRNMNVDTGESRQKFGSWDMRSTRKAACADYFSSPEFDRNEGSNSIHVYYGRVRCILRKTFHIGTQPPQMRELFLAD